MAQELEIMTRLGKHTIDPGKIIHFPRGLMGFEDHHDFTLLQISAGSPFLMLQSMQDPTLGLLVADPYTFIPAYTLRVGSAEQSMLRVDNAGQVAVLVTASIPHGKPSQATLNLTGPILINHEQKLGLQVPQSDSDFPPRWRIHEDEPAQGQGEAGAESPEQASAEAESSPDSNA